ncbi:wax ester/triacylglycerol synthase family O-acyltransferase [Variovorax sp. YR216]|uniref:WS/DGAT/MGAT family O-acyltransferase n=1 Tax=Variovorax sp. YR216 TaxID=1882828 RepID=UPI0008985CCB|nr:wax ester/triacylglycerol synthase family O-acyltransferase [Variovorax sp. YR216]SEB18988.1 acyltransferase, WS/DGAT/MGAT [Variovorax sp. YR216]
MNHLSGMDALFLHVESAEMPMHVGCLNVLSLPGGHDGDFYEDVKTFVAQRMHLATVFTRKLALMPFDLSNPVWVEDEDIDLDHHIRHITLPRPGSNRQLQQAVARQHSMLLDRSRPLWEMVIIDGLKSGEVALYTKLHHAGIDGQAGIELGRAMFDTSATPRKIKPPRPKLRRNQYQLGVAELAGAALRNTAHQYIKLFRMLPEMANAAQRLTPPIGEWTKGIAGSIGTVSDIVAPRTPLNVAITNQRSFVGRTVPVAEVKQIAQQFGVSFNDVVMATTAGALRRYLLDGGELPDESMRAAAPVSLREEGDATANNQVSMLVMDLATDEPDPILRLKRICGTSSQRKTTLNQLKSAIPMDFPMFAAPWLVSGMASMFGRSRLADWTPPAANLVISNVAGVPVPLYFAGAKVESYYPVSIATHGMALNVTVTSYNGRLDYGLIACRKALPDLDELGEHLLVEHRELLALARRQAAHAS